MTHIDIEQAKIKFVELMELVAAGEEVVIDKDQRPFVSCLRPQQRAHKECLAAHAA